MATEPTEPGPEGRFWLYATGFLVLTAAVFGRVLGHGFLGWDDRLNALENPHLNPPSLSGTLFFWRHAYADLYIPATFTVWAFLARISLEPWIFHAASLLVHAAAVTAAFRLLRRLVASDAAACAGALLFALHPVQVESVAWMSGLKDLLCGLFSLLALGTSVGFRRSPRGDLRRWSSFLIASACFLLALLSKPSAVAVPLLACVLDLFLLERRPAEIARDLAPWAACAAGWSFLTRSAQAAVDVPDIPLASRFVVAGDALGFYLGKLAWPAALAPDYGRRPAWVVEHGGLALVGLAVAVAAVLAVRAPRSLPRTAGAGAFLLFAGVAPVLGFVAFDFQRYSTAADHYLYLSMIGPALVLAGLLAGPKRGWALGCASVVLLTMAAKSWSQAAVWPDDESLWRHTLTVNARSWVAHDNLGQALESKGRRPEAIEEYTRALEINPRDARTHFNLGTALDELDRTSEAIPHLEEAVRLAPADRMSRENLAIALLRSDRPAEAEPHLRRALELEPRSYLAHYYLAGTLDRLGRTDEMLEQLREAVRLNPRFEPSRRDLEGVLEARAK